MTLIWATQVKGKWTLVADDGVTIGQTMTSANYCYRPKIREIEWKNVTLYVASCGTIKDIDYILNVFEKTLAKTKIKSTKELTYFIQDIISEAWKELKTITDNPSAAFIILEPISNTVWTVDEYAATQIPEGNNIVFGSADQNYYKVAKGVDFFSAFKTAVASDVYCDFPIVSVRDWEVKKWYFYDKEDNFYKYKDFWDECYANLCEDECCVSSPLRGPERSDICRNTDKEL